MQEIVKELLFKWECDLIEFGGGEGDHVHILFESHPSVDLSKLVNNIKTVTSRRLRSEYSQYLSQFYWGDKPQFWSGSYAIIRVGAQAPLDKLIEYVQNQEKRSKNNLALRVLYWFRLPHPTKSLGGDCAQHFCSTPIP